MSTLNRLLNLPFIWLALAVVLLVMLGMFVADRAAPYYTLHRIRAAAHANNMAAFATDMDLIRLTNNINRSIHGNTGEIPSPTAQDMASLNTNNLFQTITLFIAQGKLSRLLTQYQVQSSHYEGRDKFVQTLIHTSGTTVSEVPLVLHRTGMFSWKLTNIRLTPGVLNAARQEAQCPANTTPLPIPQFIREDGHLPPCELTAITRATASGNPVLPAQKGLFPHIPNQRRYMPMLHQPAAPSPAPAQ